jgi:hypothetical protein
MSDGNQTAKYVAIGCGVVLLLGCCTFGTLGAVCWSMVGDPHKYAHGFLNDVREGNHPAALQRMGGAYQATHDLARFQQALAALPALTQHTDATLTSVNVDGSGNAARVEGTLTTPAGAVPISMVLSKAGDYWYVEQVVVGGQPLQ